MSKARDIIVKPIITEKTMALQSVNNCVTFEVAKGANKTEIRQAIEEIFNVKVVAIRTVNVHRKAKRMQRYEGFKSAYKKAIVRLEPGQTIKAFEV